ncbi:ACP S-malonyltransferase [Sessilibacter corallicola]|uniref:Malonyl CoA-acyl carrier protein transacylase n=1 Tax=Sessilibacter corallicola TaxID=2904075 RepID=A0ABQ0A966_9GAMM|nr:ACP S-malonyltransferase [Sessilibacter corallicola]MCE2030226.1 ACP S-malonyltransferase [Sessilibacter corallicola]
MSTQNLAFIFPGQGAQSQGMLAELAAEHSIVEQTFAEASDVLGYDLWALSQNDEDGQINMTEITQPLLLTASTAIWRVWQSLSDIRPNFVAGHSLGEWSALVAAGVVEFKDAVALVRNRGKYMQEAVPAGVGSMAALIGLSDQDVNDACVEAAGDQVVAAVNYNAPGQVVIAGHKEAVDRAAVAAKAKGAKKVMPLAVSAPFHTILMKPASQRLQEDLQSVEFKAPEINIIHNVSAAGEPDPEKIKNIMIQQIYLPVRWVECVQALAANSIEMAVECGPGKVLSGMNKRIDKSIKSYQTDAPDTIAATVQSFA